MGPINSAFSLLVYLLLAPNLAALPPSSPRKSINYGPVHAHPSRSSIFSHPDQIANQAELHHSLASFNALSAASLAPLHTDTSSLNQFGIELATRFLHHLHPSATTFQLTSAHLSKHTRVLHAYFVQTIPLANGKDGFAKIHNAVANLNIDLNPKSTRFGLILSHSDSFHPLSEPLAPAVTLNSFRPVTDKRSSRCVVLKEKFDKALQYASSIDANSLHQDSARQQVLGIFPPKLAELSDSAKKILPTHFTEDELRLIAECEMSAEDGSAAHSEGKSQIVDPRVALISFLTLAADQETESHLRSNSLEDLVNSIHIVEKQSAPFEFAGLSHPGGGSLFELYNVPGALKGDSASGHATAPTEAELAWLSVDAEGSDSNTGSRELQMVWRFEYRSQSNWYESYVDATQPGSVPMVVDWVKDFRPTSETPTTYAEHKAIQASIAKTFNFSPRRHDSDRRHHSGDQAEANLPVLQDGETQKARPATYKVFPWSVNDPTEGKREVIESPSDSVASPLGWHTIPPVSRHGKQLDIGNLPEGWARLVSRHGLRATDTRGNNVYAQENWEGQGNWEANYRPNGTEALKFQFKLGWNHTDEKGSSQHIDPKRYIDAAVSELFYTCNQFHDLTHRYGFDEESGNFQEHNFGRGGKGGDAVIANAQDGSGYNNANFATPPDGRHGQMRMYVWNGQEPWRDGDLEAGIVIHEYSHGVSTRLTGGPANSACLGWGEAGGMGEGWGDAFATLIRMHNAKPVEFTMGEWASGMKNGIRKYKYSLDNSTNPESYKTLDKPGYWGVHAIGEVWAEMLFTVAEELIQKHGFEPSLFPPTDENDTGDFYKLSSLTGRKVPKRGNTLFFQLVLDGMKIQPCRPGFFDARDAILEADEVLTGGENKCEIWRAFTSRGLGPKASLKGSTPWGGGVRSDDFVLPEGVCGEA